MPWQFCARRTHEDSDHQTGGNDFDSPGVPAGPDVACGTSRVPVSVRPCTAPCTPRPTARNRRQCRGLRPMAPAQQARDRVYGGSALHGGGCVESASGCRSAQRPAAAYSPLRVPATFGTSGGVRRVTRQQGRPGGTLAVQNDGQLSGTRLESDRMTDRLVVHEGEIVVAQRQFDMLTITIKPLPGTPSGPTHWQGLRRWLKAMLRSYGWRCIRIEPVCIPTDTDVRMNVSVKSGIDASFGCLDNLSQPVPPHLESKAGP